jgi:homoserine O-succinyltransferase
MFVQALLSEYQQKVMAHVSHGSSLAVFPEQKIIDHMHNTWHDSGVTVVGNWIGLVYQLTHVERTRPFMDGVDLSNPLGWETLAQQGAA